MEAAEVAMHVAAGRHYGQQSTCGTKIDYGSEETADIAAQIMSVKHRRSLEAYPCAWCSGWHIGRKMTDDERRQFMKQNNHSGGN